MVTRQDLSPRELAAGVARALRPLAERAGVGTEKVGDEQRAASLAALVGRLGRFVDDLEAYAGCQALAPQTLRPTAVLTRFAAAVQPLLDRRLALQVRVDDACPPCRADPRALHDALFRLVVHARDAMPEGGTVALTAGRGRLDDGSAATEFGVLDGGPGLPPELLATATLPFTTRAAEDGGDLGLAAVEGFALQSGGCLRLRSSAEGTSALLLLPSA
jgi:C4-dicarboxylate-specific signal transduction histidine kinase